MVHVVETGMLRIVVDARKRLINQASKLPERIFWLSPFMPPSWVFESQRSQIVVAP